MRSTLDFEFQLLHLMSYLSLEADSGMFCTVVHSVLCHEYEHAAMADSHT